MCRFLSLTATAVVTASLVRGMWSRRGRARAGWLAAALAAVLLVHAARRPAHHETIVYLPDAYPAHVAHLLADFSHRHHQVDWVLEEEQNNLTWWRYTVRYECGARCEGGATVQAEADSPARGHHLVHELDRRCEPLLPLLPWPTSCEVTETVHRVRGEGAGAALEQRSTARCGALRTLAGSCAASLRDDAAARLDALRRALQRRSPHN